MSIERAVTLLSSSNDVDNRNGCALIINAAATAANLPEIINSNVIPLLVQKSTSSNEDMKMKFCWAINNLCVHDQGRDAVFRQGVVNCFPSILKSQDLETIKKACWALTNIARHPQAQQQIVSSGSFSGLVQILSNPNDELRGAALQPLCNLVLDANNQLAFLNSGGLRPSVQLLKSRDDKIKELAVTLVSFVTTNHDSVREGLLNAGVLPPLSDIINGDGTPKMQEYAVNALVNLSLAEVAEAAILNQGAVPPIVGLLSSTVLKLQQQSAMLLSNLLTNADIRQAVRYLSWLEPLMDIVRKSDAATVQQALRCLVNITFDGHCRYMLVNANADRDIENARNKLRDPTVSQLADTAIKNFGVSVPSDVKAEVDRTLQSGGVKRVAAPTAQRSTATQDAFAGLDDLLGGASTPSRPTPAFSQPAAPKPKARDPLDDLGDLLEDIPGTKTYNAPPPRQPVQSARDPLDDLLDMPSAPQVRQSHTPQNTYSQPSYGGSSKSGLDDLDDLLGGLSVSNPTPKKATANDDLDSLLSGLGGGSSHSAPPPSNRQLDDIDSLLSEMGSGGGYSQPSRNNAVSSGMDDIDSLLADIGSSRPSNNRTSTFRAGGESIDDLLAGLGGPSRPSNPRHSGFSAIDDLLNDLGS